MCLTNRGYFSPPRVISSFYRERLYHPCKCGECAECKEQRRREWNFRLYQEFRSCISRGGYVIMDLLSYNDEHLPHLSDFVDFDNPDIDFSCFNYKDVQDYLKRLRKKFPDGALRSFVACEYGSDEKYIDYYGHFRKATNRPHYHQLLFVQDGSISPLDVFNAVHDSWQNGITQIDDKRGLSYVLNKYVIKKVSLGASYYVSKYVVKDSPFQATIDKRLAMLVNELSYYCGYKKIVRNNTLVVDEFSDAEMFQSVSRSIWMKKMIRKLRYHITQRVYPSEGFGVGFLNDVDHDELMRTNVVSMPDNKLQRRYITLPYYYTRKLYQTCVKWHGVKVWKLTDEGKKQRMWKQAREYDLWRKKFEAIKHEFRYQFDVPSLVHYVCHQRGRFRGDIIADLDFEDKIRQPNLWITHFSDDDVARYGCRFLSQNVGYLDDPPDHLERVVDRDYFISKYVFFDNEKEKILDKVFSLRSNQNDTKNVAYELRQEILKRFKDSRYNMPVMFSQ